jgi:formamidopyrimidine-DNA glycosylase
VIVLFQLPQLALGELVVVRLVRFLNLTPVHLEDGVVAPAPLTFPKVFGNVAECLLPSSLCPITLSKYGNGPGGGTADASDLKSEGELNHRVGSNPSPGTRNYHVAKEKQATMPELPEVQILVNQLRPRLVRATIQAVEVRDAKIKLQQDLVGRKILRVWRRGKNIIFDLSGGLHLLVHLRMTGWFEFTKPKRYRVAIRTGKGTAYFEDGRRFGVMQAMTSADLQRVLAALGPDPIIDGCDLSQLRKTTRSVKVALLDQRMVAGVGNIYASESLWRARINPRRRADRLRPKEVRALERGIMTSLRKAIKYGPRIFDVQQFAVYGRAGKPCRRCGSAIRKMVQAQRSTYCCPQCQR